MGRNIARTISRRTRTFDELSVGLDRRLQCQSGCWLLLLGNNRADVGGTNFLEFLVDDPVR